MSKRCPKCHGQYDDIYRFCGDCGISLVAATEGASGKSIFYKLFHLDEWFPTDYEKAEAYVKLLYISLAITIFGYGMEMFYNVLEINPYLLFKYEALIELVSIIAIPLIFIGIFLNIYFIYVNIYITYKSGIIKFLLKLIASVVICGLICVILGPLGVILAIYSAYSNRKRMEMLSQYKRFLKYPLMVILIPVAAVILLVAVLGVGFIGAITGNSAAIADGSIIISGILALAIIMFSVFAPTMYMAKFIRSEVAIGTGFYKTILLSFSVPVMWLLCIVACYNILSHTNFGVDLVADAGFDNTDIGVDSSVNITEGNLHENNVSNMTYNGINSTENSFDNHTTQSISHAHIVDNGNLGITSISTPVQPAADIENIIAPVSAVPANHDIVLRNFFGMEQLHITSNAHGGLSIFDGQHQMIGLASTNHNGIDINLLNGEHHYITTGGDMFDEKALFSGSIHHHNDGSITITDKMQQIVRTIDAQGNIFDEKHLPIGTIKA